MPWTDPRTWATGDDTTAALLNTYVRDNVMMYGPSRPGVSVYQGAVQSIPNGIFASTNVLFNTELYDIGGYHSTTTNTERLTIPSGLDGFYFISANIRFASNAAGKRIALMYGAGSIAGLIAGNSNDPSNTGGQSGINVSKLVHANAGDYVYMVATQDSGVALNTSGNYLCWFQMTWLGKDPF